MCRALLVAVAALVACAAVAGTDTPQQAMADGKAALQKSDSAGAEAAFRRAVGMLEQSAPGSLDLAEAYQSLGGVEEDLRHLGAAQAYLLKAIAIQEAKAPGTIELATSYNNFGLVAQEVGDLGSAETYYRKGLAISEEKAPGSLQAASGYANLGGVALQEGHLNDAEALLTKSQQIREKLAPNSADLATTYNNLGALARARGDYQGAGKFFHMAADIQGSISPDSLDLARTYDNIGTVYHDLGDQDGALKLFQQALAIREKKAPGSMILASTYNNIGRIDEEKHDLAGAEDCFKKVVDLVQPVAPHSLRLASTFSNLGGLCEDEKKDADAEAWYLKAIAIQRDRAPQSSDLAQTDTKLGSLTLRLNRNEDAAKYLAEAFQIIEGQRAEVNDAQSRALLAQDNQEIVGLYLEALYKQSDSATALNVLEETKSRSAAEGLAEKGAVSEPAAIEQLNDQIDKSYRSLASAQDDQAAETVRTHLANLESQKRQEEEQYRTSDARAAAIALPQPLDANSAASELRPGDLLLDYFVGQQASFLLAIRPTGSPSGQKALEIKFLEIPVGGADLNSRVNDLRLAFSNPDGDYEAPSAEMYDLLLKPAEAWLNDASVKRVVISSNGCLDALSFGALAPKGGDPLAVRKPISYIPSITALHEIRSIQRSNPELPLVAFGDPKYNENVISLRPTRDEVVKISQLYGVKPLLGADATPAAVLAQGPNTRILHLACHGLLEPEEPYASGLALSPTAGNDGLLLGYQIVKDLKLNADLVVLSACQTGLGKSEGIEGVDGLARAFQFAGAKAVMVSLWSVADESTSEFMQGFYSALKEGKPKDEALQAAEIAIRKKFPHPYYWAPFILEGSVE